MVEDPMINGVVTLRQILFHPLLLVRAYGFTTYLGLLLKALSRNRYQFLPLIFAITQRACATKGQV